MIIRNSSHKDNFIQELNLLWEDAVRTVYLKEPPKDIGLQEAEHAWSHTGMTPLEYVKYIASPHKATNQIIRGQKAREKRWAKWVKWQEETDKSCRCMDCNVNTFTINEYYMVKNKIWNAVVKGKTKIVNLLDADKDGNLIFKDKNGKRIYNPTKVHMHPGMLCIGCLEKRIGRKLTSVDFTNYPINTESSYKRSVRLLERLSSKKISKNTIDSFGYV